MPTEALDQLDRALRDGGDLQWFGESSAEVAAAGDLGDLRLIVLSDPNTDPAVAALASDPALTVAESTAINRLFEDTRRKLAGLSTAGRLIVTDGQPIKPTDIVDAVRSLLA